MYNTGILYVEENDLSQAELNLNLSRIILF